MKCNGENQVKIRFICRQVESTYVMHTTHIENLFGEFGRYEMNKIFMAIILLIRHLVIRSDIPCVCVCAGTIISSLSLFHAIWTFFHVMCTT